MLACVSVAFLFVIVAMVVIFVGVYLVKRIFRGEKQEKTK